MWYLADLLWMEMEDIKATVKKSQQNQLCPDFIQEIELDQ